MPHLSLIKYIKVIVQYYLLELLNNFNIPISFWNIHNTCNYLRVIWELVLNIRAVCIQICAVYLRNCNELQEIEYLQIIFSVLIANVVLSFYSRALTWSNDSLYGFIPHFLYSFLSIGWIDKVKVNILLHIKTHEVKANVYLRKTYKEYLSSILSDLIRLNKLVIRNIVDWLLSHAIHYLIKSLCNCCFLS